MSAAPIEGSQPAAPEKMNILLVDDQPEGLIALEAILERLGQNLIKARSGREALRHLLVRDFAVILLDIQMPEMDGYETAVLIRERPSSRHTPIIFLTAWHKADVQMMKGYSVGAVDYIFKPIEPEVLRSKVSVFVELARKNELVKRQAEQLRIREQEARELAEARAELLSALESKNLDLEAVNKELEAFSYSVSHDLRAPLRAIDGYSQTLLEDFSGALDDRGKRYLKNVRDSAKYMAQLIDALLSLSRVTRSDLKVERIDLTAVARTVAARLQEQRKVEVTVEDGLVAYGDGRLLGIVVENLLGNAWKFTSRREDPKVEVGSKTIEGQRVFFVKDNGAGFDMAFSSKLFGAFQRLHSAGEFEGTGIGLATVQRIIRRHGGRIWAEGKVEEGATFFFTLADVEAQ